MKKSKELLERWETLQLEDWAEIPSKSSDTVWVVKKVSGQWVCECPALPAKEGVRKECRHIRQAKRNLKYENRYNKN